MLPLGYSKKFSHFGPAVWPPIANIFMSKKLYYILAEVSGVARGSFLNRTLKKLEFV